MVVVDTETTGLGHNARPPRPDGVIQVGYAWRTPRGKIARWAALCNPGRSYLSGGRATEALWVNGLQLPTILAAPSSKTVAAEFRAHLEDIRDESGCELELRSYNRSFDEPFLSARPWGIPSQMWGPCLMQAAQDHLGLSRWPKLQVALNLLGIMPPSGRSHTADVDAHAALLIHERILKGQHR